MKALIATVCVLAVLVGGFFVVAPAYQKDKVIAVFTSGTNARMCFNSYKDELKDPDTAYLTGSRKLTKEQVRKYGADDMDPVYDEYDSILKIEVRAKNGFGAYRKIQRTCPLVDGEFSEDAMLIYRIDRLTR